MSDDIDFNERLRRAATAPKKLPGTYTDSATGRTTGFSTAVVSASAEDVKRYSDSGNLCGECEHFCDLGTDAFAGQLAQTRFLTRLVDEYGWKLHHAFPGGIPQAGFCEAHGYLTQAFSAAKDCAFTPRRGKLRRQASDNALIQIGKDKRTAVAKQRQRDVDFRKRFGL